jgi:hypothetical protein
MRQLKMKKDINQIYLLLLLKKVHLKFSKELIFDYLFNLTSIKFKMWKKINKNKTKKGTDLY